MFGLDGRISIACFTKCSKSKDLFGVAEHRDVGVVGREDKLSAAFFIAHSGHHVIGDKAVVKVVLWLIDDQWSVGLQEQEEQNGSGLLAL